MGCPTRCSTHARGKRSLRDAVLRPSRLLRAKSFCKGTEGLRLLLRSFLSLGQSVEKRSLWGHSPVLPSTLTESAQKQTGGPAHASLAESAKLSKGALSPLGLRSLPVCFWSLGSSWLGSPTWGREKRATGPHKWQAGTHMCTLTQERSLWGRCLGEWSCAGTPARLSHGLVLNRPRSGGRGPPL